MAWWEEIKSYLQKSGIDSPREDNAKTIWEMLEEVFFNDAVDILYFWLGVFTYVYFFAVALLYLGAISSYEIVATKILLALAEPYLGAVGIYTILKETRKRKRTKKPRHWGEIFVVAWIALFVISIFLAFFFKEYTFNRTLELIMTLSVSIGIIYIGGEIHKP